MILSNPRSFFFSSRRRHTRWNCDWSSDVCSSDLWPGSCSSSDFSGSEAVISSKLEVAMKRRPGLVGLYFFTGMVCSNAPEQAFQLLAGAEGDRSEERRVGKECRARQWGEHLK